MGFKSPPSHQMKDRMNAEKSSVHAVFLLFSFLKY